MIAHLDTTASQRLRGINAEAGSNVKPHYHHSNSHPEQASQLSTSRLISSFLAMSPAHHLTLYTTKGLPPNGWCVAAQVSFS